MTIPLTDEPDLSPRVPPRVPPRVLVAGLVAGPEAAPETALPPLRIPLPSPPFLKLGGVVYLLEHVRIDQLEAWRREHNLVPHRQAVLSKPGWRPTHDGKMQWGGLGTITLHWPASWMETGDGAAIT